MIPSSHKTIDPPTVHDRTSIALFAVVNRQFVTKAHSIGLLRRCVLSRFTHPKQTLKPSPQHHARHTTNVTFHGRRCQRLRHRCLFSSSTVTDAYIGIRPTRAPVVCTGYRYLFCRRFASVGLIVTEVQDLRKIDFHSDLRHPSSHRGRTNHERTDHDFDRANRSRAHNHT